MPPPHTQEMVNAPLHLVQNWVIAFNANDADCIAAMYAPTAVLWGTLAAEIIHSPQDILAYFHRAFRTDNASIAALGTHTKNAGENLNRQIGSSVELLTSITQEDDDVAVVSGAYLLRLNKLSQEQLLPARFTFVLKHTVSGWRIMNHHSSAMPVVGV